MKCPACRSAALERVADSATGLELDSCSECLGVWFDAGELQQLYKSPELRKRFLPVGGESVHHTYEVSTTARRCSRCHHGMERPTVGGVTLDVCRPCQGIWFDHGELQKITKIWKTRGLEGDPLVVSQVRAGNASDHKAGPLDGVFRSLGWFFSSFLSTALR